MLSQRTRHRLALALFWLVGPLTTLVLAAGLCVRHTGLDGAATTYERAIAKAAGWNVTIDRVEYVQPNTVRLHSAALAKLGVTDLQCRWSRSPNETTLDGSFATSRDTSLPRVTWSLTKILAPATQLRTQITLNVPKAAPIPVSLLLLNNSNNIDGVFVGSLRGEEMWEESRQAYRWSIFVQNATVRQVPLELLASQITPYRVTGNVEGLAIDDAHWRDGDGLVAASGWIHLSHGTLDSELLARFVDTFHLTSYPRDAFATTASGAAFSFDQFAVKYQLSRRGALFDALGDNGIIMHDAARVVSLLIPRGTPPTPVPYRDILATLAPLDAPRVPWTPQTREVLRLLPTELR